MVLLAVENAFYILKGNFRSLTCYLYLRLLILHLKETQNLMVLKIKGGIQPAFVLVKKEGGGPLITKKGYVSWDLHVQK